MKPVLLVVNPTSAGGRTGRQWPAIADKLQGLGLEFDTEMTSRPLEATEIARRGVEQGRRVVAAVGGDGTISETAGGFFEDGEPVPTQTALGVLPTGTGGDFRRTFAIPPDPLLAARVLLAGERRRIDAGRVTYETAGGRREMRTFVNIADAGIGGEVVDRVNRGSKHLNGSLTFLAASVRTLLTYRNRPMRIVVDGEPFEAVAQQVVVANAQYFGGGMRMAPLADPGDGLLDVIVVGDVNVLENARGLARIRAGTHLEASNPKWTLHRARRVEVASPAQVRVDVDGEQPGFLPAVFEVLPGAIELLVP